MIRIGWCCLVAVALGACADNRVQECFADGELYYCPADKQCGGLQRLCVDPGGCGNGVVESGEECDDGNVVAGDLCSPDCKIEVCGNHRVDPGEVCDDGNSVDSDGCTNDCMSDNRCGNGKTDTAVGEECDDGNTDVGDGCGKTCRFERCGNHITDPGEDCDDGNATAGDGCSPTCLFEGCGNGRVDPGELCDDGNTVDTDNCNNNCTSDNRCGNHIVDHNVHEVCDEGGVLTDHCTADCRSTRTCGDGIVDVGEECDNGVDAQGNDLNGNDKDCRADCFFNRCGDGFANTSGTVNHEDCDDAPPADPHSSVAKPTESAGCNADCTVALCNDHKVNQTAGEQCDDGPGLNADDHDCTAGCKVNVCGDDLPNTIGPSHKEACDDGNRVDGDDCTNQCTLPHCGDGILEGLEQCDDGNTQNDDGCSATCKFETCGDGIKNGSEECDRADPALAVGTCNLDCTLSRCGDGKVNRDAGEQCDDGPGKNADDHDCTAACKVNTCGDGLPNTIGPNRKEACDDGNRVDSDSCTNQCKLPLCGDGILELLEQCDDGNNASDDGCSATCRFETCGDGIKNGTEECDRADPALAVGACNLDCTLSRCGDGKINRDAGEECDDGTGNNANDRDCTALCKVNVCGDGIPNTIGPNHKEQCDDHNRIDSDACTNQCTLPRCGDGILEGVEQCDDGNNLDNDGCSAGCRFETCGDGVVNGTEACDYALTPETCNLDCTASVCGDGKINPNASPPEECDDGHRVSGDGCSADCTLEHCGNNVIDAFEDCDGTANPSNFACSSRCRFEACGNGILDPTEECDLGSANSDDGACLTGCTVAVCGDGKTRTGVEQCDDGESNGDNGNCTKDCRTNVCGDGHVDTSGAQVEDCDDGPNNTDVNLCPYNNASCPDRCTTACHVLVGTFQGCGDGIVNGPEVCDDHNLDACGSCSADCAQVTSQHAVGFLIPVSGSQTQTGETFTLDDGIHGASTFTFILLADLQPGSRLTAQLGEIEYVGDESAAEMGALIATAIQDVHDAGLLSIQVTTTDAVSVGLRHDRATALGNVQITEDVSAVTFFAVGMVGGAGGDCAPGVGCRTDDDCGSGVCRPDGTCDGL